MEQAMQCSIGSDHSSSQGLFKGYGDFTPVVEAMLKGGFTPAETAKIVGGNYVRMLRGLRRLAAAAAAHVAAADEAQMVAEMRLQAARPVAVPRLLPLGGLLHLGRARW